MVLLLLAHAAATLFMVGVIWFVQVVHYPLFARVGTPDFSAYSLRHTRLTGLVVGPPIESSVALVWMGLPLVAGSCLSTPPPQPPRHTTLGRGFDPAAHQFLVTSNWMRTVLWSLRGLVVLCILYQAMG